MTALLRCTGIDKSYPGVKALSNVDFDLLPVEVHALCGEKGAGKSTLMHLLAGVDHPDSGTIEMDGAGSVRISDEHHAQQLGIAIRRRGGMLLHGRRGGDKHASHRRKTFPRHACGEPSLLLSRRTRHILHHHVESIGGGLAIEWLNESIFGITPGDETAIALLCNQLVISPSPVLFLPHLAGRGTPHIDPRSGGAFVGLSLKTGRAEMLQAVIDAQAFEARLNLEALEHLEIPVNDIRAVDWGARLWRTLQIKATVLDRPIHTLRTPEAALCGCAILAQTALGDFPDIESACRECVRIGETIEPVSRAREIYMDAFERYRPLYSTLRPFYHHWNAEKRTAVPV